MRTPAKIEHGIRCCASANIDKCTGCPYAGLHMGIGCKTILLRDAQDYLKEIRRSAARIEVMAKQLESAQPKWISVEERLPEPDKNVLTLENRKRVRIGYYSEDCEEWVINDMVAYDEDITHWMPLPEPPKEE